VDGSLRPPRRWLVLAAGHRLVEAEPIELSQEYVEMATRRIVEDAPLFNEQAPEVQIQQPETTA
jgi:hypothetical protein